MADVILVADDDPDILRFVELNLRLEGYDVIAASDGQQALDLARAHAPALAILDVMMPKVDGYEVCQELRNDGRTAQMCIIMLTAKSMAADKVLGLTTGADDYISKPFDPLELVARVKTTLRRTREMRSVSPLTNLPGNVQIEVEVERRFGSDESFALLWLDLDNFKAFNDRYGFIRGDEVINYLATILRGVATAHPGTFIGHVGGDDFVMLTSEDDLEAMCREIVEGFDADVARFYDPEDAARRSLTVTDRLGRQVEYPLVSVSIGVAIDRPGRYGDHRELVQAATEMKSYAKRHPGSWYAIERRRGPSSPQTSG